MVASPSLDHCGLILRPVHPACSNGEGEGGVVTLKDLNATIATKHMGCGEPLHARHSHVLFQQLHRQMTGSVSQRLDVMRRVSQRPDTLPHLGLQTHPPDCPLPFLFYFFFKSVTFTIHVSAIHVISLSVMAISFSKAPVGINFI